MSEEEILQPKVPLDLPRTTTKAEWRKIWQWTRTATRIVNVKLRDNMPVLRRVFTDTMIYGTGKYIVKPDGNLEHISTYD